MSWTPPPDGPCMRRAWLTLGSLTVGLEGPGWFCPSLDLGFPDVRDVVSVRPDQDGVDDRTQYFGARTVTAQITALAGAGARVDAVAASFAPFMVPSARPTLHWVLDRPGAPERTLTLRAAGYSWPIAGPYERDIQLQWVAADPIVRDPTGESSTAWAGTGSGGGRAYDLTFNRIYPPGGGSPTTGVISSPGDVAVQPLLRVYGPISGPVVTLRPSVAGASTFTVRFYTSYVINAGHFVDVDTRRHTVYLDGDVTQSQIVNLDWMNTSWPVLPVAPAVTYLTVAGTNTSGITQVQALWHDGFLT